MSSPLDRWQEPRKGSGYLYDSLKRLSKSYAGTVENAEARIGRLEDEVLRPIPLKFDLQLYGNQITALQQRVDLLTRALAKAGLVDEYLFEDRPLADTCPWSCDPGTDCPSCARWPEQYCWRCDAAKEAS